MSSSQILPCLIGVKHNRVSSPSEGSGHPSSRAHLRQSVRGKFSLLILCEFPFVSFPSLSHTFKKLRISYAFSPMDAADALIARMIRIFSLFRAFRLLYWFRPFWLRFSERSSLSFGLDPCEDLVKVSELVVFTGFYFSASTTSHLLTPYTANKFNLRSIASACSLNAETFFVFCQ